MSTIAPLLERNRRYAEKGSWRDTPRLPFLPHQGLYVITCIDPRTDPAMFLGLRFADAIVARTVGGRVTQAVVQDVAYIGYLVEQKAPDGPYFEAAIIHHTDCGSGLLADDELRHGFAARGGYRTSGRTSTAGNRAARSAACCQWVVAARLSMIPAAASANAPTQTDAMRAPRAWTARRALLTARGGSVVGMNPGTTTVSATSSASSPASTVTEKLVVVGTRPARCPQIENAYRSRSSGWPKTCAGIERSKATTAGRASATTWCTDSASPGGGFLVDHPLRHLECSVGRRDARVDRRVDQDL
jgi:hypothetical protein